MVLYVRELTEAENTLLRSWVAGSDMDLKHRARVILLSADGYRIPEIGEIVKAHPANLRKWIHRFNQTGTQGLVSTRSGGAKPRFSDEQKKKIIALAQTRPRELGLNFTKWTLHRLAEQAEKQKIVDRISHEYVRQILLSANCSYRHSGPPTLPPDLM
ncbi:MAG: helix-turn-helix domain-containing protein [Anaerolineae bacterium]